MPVVKVLGFNFHYMDILELQAFIAVARHCSFSKASLQLGLTQPAVSKRVARLEASLDTKLFDRVARKISLTEAGDRLLPRAEDLLNQAKDMQRLASSLKQEVSGKLSIAISHHIALYRMPPVLKHYKTCYPQVKLDIRFEDSEQAFSSVERGDIEFAVITLPSELPANLIAQKIWQDRLFFVSAKDHPLAQGKSLSLQDLAEYPCVLPTPETETHQIAKREFDTAELELDMQLSTNNLQSLRMLVVAGIGWSLLPETMLDGNMKLLECGTKLQRNLGLVMHTNRSLSNAATAMQTLINA